MPASRCALPPGLTTFSRELTVAAGRFGPGHLGELTPVAPFDLVDAVLEETRCVQRRLRDLPTRVGVYFLLAMCLFPEVGYRLVWQKLAAALAGAGLETAWPPPKALRDLRRRVGSAPPLVRSPRRTAGPAVHARRAVRVFPDGLLRRLQLDQAPQQRPERGPGPQSRGGYPRMELMTLVQTGTRAVIGAVFGATSDGETAYARQLLHHLGPNMLVL